MSSFTYLGQKIPKKVENFRKNRKNVEKTSKNRIFRHKFDFFGHSSYPKYSNFDLERQRVKFPFQRVVDEQNRTKISKLQNFSNKKRILFMSNFFFRSKISIFFYCINRLEMTQKKFGMFNIFSDFAQKSRYLTSKCPKRPKLSKIT